MKDPEKLIEVIEKYVVYPYKKLLLKEIQASIRLKTTGNLCSDLGKTKLGGSPDLPKNKNWPRSKYYNTPLSFLGQINCNEIKELDELNALPKEGLLYFFFNLDSGDDGKVIFSREVRELERAIPPHEFKEQKTTFLKRLLTGKPKKRILKESEVNIYKEYNFPSWDSLRVALIQKEAKTDISPINAFEEGFFENDTEESETTSNHHLLGNYNGIQDEFHELNFIDDEVKEHDNLSLEQMQKALKWKLLFQFDSDNNLEMSWGDWGRIYFFIHEDDLKNENFDNIKISADSY